MHLSRFGFLALASAVASSVALLSGCGSSTPGSEQVTPGGVAGASVANAGSASPGTGGALASSAGGSASPAPTVGSSNPMGPAASGGSAAGGAAVAAGGASAGAENGGTAGAAEPTAGGDTSSGGGMANGGSSAGAENGGTAGAPNPAAGGDMASGGAPVSPGGASGIGVDALGADPGTDGDGDFVIMPPYSGRVQSANVPHSTQYQFMMTSQIYPGGSRPITVYIPAQYVDGTEAPFIIVTDGNAPASGLPEIVSAAENHYEDEDPTTSIPPMAFVFIPPGSNRSGEYDTVSDAYTRFVNTEVLPLVESDAAIKAKYPGFKLSTDRGGRAAYGCSSGSPAAMGLGWFGDFGRVVSYSGTFVALQKTAEHPLGAWEYPEMILATTPPKALRIFLHVSENDNGANTPEADARNWVIGNRNMAAALKTMGYHYRFIFAEGAGHCDGGVKSQTYSETLAWVWRGYTPK